MAAGGTSRLQVIVQGALKGARDLDKLASSTARLHKETIGAEKAMQRAQRRTFLMNQVLFTLRRGAFYTTAAIGAMGVAAATMGFKFNMAMENNMVAFEHFLGSASAADAELTHLYELAARTPFEFEQLAGATRRFMAFGFSLEETNRYMEIIGDTAAGLGGDTASNIERLVLVLGQVRATGRVLGQDMLQLQQLGINTTEIFSEQLGITRQQMRQGIGELNIPAEVAIPALMRGMQGQFEGMAEAQSKTMSGMLTTLHDFTAQLMGDLTENAFNRVKGALPGIIDLTQELGKAARDGAGFTELLQIMDDRLGARGTLVQNITILRNVFTALWEIIAHGIIPAFKNSYIILSFTLLPILKVFSDVLLWVSKHTDFLSWALVYLTTVFIFQKTWLILSTIWMGRFGLAVLFNWIVVKGLLVPLRVLAVMFLLMFTRSSLAATGLTLLATAETRAMWAARLLTVQMWLLDLAMLANPVGLVIIGIAALIAILVFAEYKTGVFTVAIKWLWGWMVKLYDIVVKITDKFKNSWWGKILGTALKVSAWTNPITAPWMAANKLGMFEGGKSERSALPSVSGMLSPQMPQIPIMGGGWQQPQTINLDATFRTERKILAQEVYSARMDTQARR